MQDAVRRTVERTFQSTVGSAGQTRGRAQELADEVLRRAEGSASRGVRGVRQAGHKQREAAVNVGDRLREVVVELTGVRSDEIERLRSQVERLGARVEQLERKLGASSSGPPSSARGTTAVRAAAGTARAKRSKPAAAKQKRANTDTAKRKRSNRS